MRWRDDIKRVAGMYWMQMSHNREKRLKLKKAYIDIVCESCTLDYKIAVILYKDCIFSAVGQNVKIAVFLVASNHISPSTFDLLFGSSSW